MIRLMARAALAASFAMIAPSAFGQDAAALPTAEKVFQDYVEATGGKAAYEKLTNRVTTGTFEVSGANIKGKVTITQAAPNKMKTFTDLGAIGTQSQGTDGETAWEISTFNGERILEGEEKDAVALQALFNGEIRPKDRYTKTECVAIEDIDGKPAAKLVLTRKAGKPVVEYYDLGSHLMVRQLVTTKSPMGEMVIDQQIGDYRKEDGVLMPHTVTQKIAGQEMVLSFSEIKHNVDLPADTFALPKEILAIQKKKAK